MTTIPEVLPISASDWPQDALVGLDRYVAPPVSRKAPLQRRATANRPIQRRRQTRI